MNLQRVRSGVFLVVFLLAGALRASANPAPNAVTDWALIVQQSIHNAGAPRSAGTSEILHTMAMLAMYDAVVAIEGGFEPYGGRIQAAAGADARAAAATAAYRTARARIAASQIAFLDSQYATYMAGVADGPAKTAGVQVGEQAAAAILALRANDNFANVVLYECSAIPVAVGEFEPDAGCPAVPTAPQPVDVKVGLILPFTFANGSDFRPSGPDPLTSSAYAEDFNETREYGRRDSAVRTAEQTDVAYFWSENPYVHWNRNLVRLAVANGLSLRDAARFFAIVHTAASDAIIAGFEAKYFYATWRPRTAIPRADSDGNPDTDAEPAWKPLLSVNHPEYPSGHGFWTTAVLEAVNAFFGTNRVTWTLLTSQTAVPQVVKTERTYQRLNAILLEVTNARVWAGLHWRHSVRHGAQIGRHVAAHVSRHFFRPVQ